METTKALDPKALEAALDATGVERDCGMEAPVAAAIRAYLAALSAQPAAPDHAGLVETALEVAWAMARCSSPTDRQFWAGQLKRDIEAIAALSRVQEPRPTVWMMPEHIEGYQRGDRFGVGWANHEKTEAYTVPLYATPPAPQGDAAQPAADGARQFDVGYTLAVANLIHLHDEPGMAADVMAQTSIKLSDINKMNLTDYDMKPLRKMFREEHVLRRSKPASPAASQGGAE